MKFKKASIFTTLVIAVLMVYALISLFVVHRQTRQLQDRAATLPELFRRSDFVNVSITLCDATRDLINAPVFAAANPDLLLVNTSRGGIVNEHDLYVALTTGQIRAAASDVFVHEPPACDDPLIHLDNFIATFHIGGSTYESLERVSNRAVDYVFEYTGVPEQKEVIGS